MKITGFETVRAEELENLLWLQVETDEGIVGLGETYMMPRTVEAYIHEVVAPKLLGRDPLQIDRIAKDLNGYLGFRSSGAEVRGKFSGFGFAAENAAEEAEEHEIVFRHERVGDDDMRHEAGESLDLLAAVLVDVHNQMGGRGGADLLDVGILGAAHLGDALHGRARVDAEAAAADDILRKAEVAQQFGEAGDEADDARGALRRRVKDAEGVAESGACCGHGGFYDAGFPPARESRLPLRTRGEGVRFAGSCVRRRRGRGR